MSASAVKSSGVSRSVYVAQLRRAFLLRAHPDRFRNSEDHVRRGQARLLQALSERWNAQDFLDYTANVAPSSSNRMIMTSNSNFSKNSKTSKIPYVLEKRDGSLLEQTIQLDDSVENLLKSLAKALELSGAASLPPPPPPPPKPEPRKGLDANKIFWAQTSHSADSSNGTERFDINTQKGRDLMAFLKSTPASAIEERRSFRMDASAAALVARRLYSFQAIDGVSMGWSSESFAILLRSLIRLHEEHSSRFHVDSFYPLRLVFSHDDFQSKLDVYGGVLYLHPAATQLQMLETLQEVTKSNLEEFQQNRILLQDHTAQVQNDLGVKLAKGFSCSSEEYHSFLDRLVRNLGPGETKQEDLTRTSRALELERVRIVVESPAACRRARLTKEGYIQAHALMTLDELRNATSRLSEPALRKREEQRDDEKKCKEAVQQIQWALGLQKVTRRGILSHAEFLGSLSRLLDKQSEYRSKMAGYSLGIAGSGQFCHLSDDGSLVVPHNWT